ncbi:unnamed protein product [Rotaria sp. Silwood1]|nr:unnamed protein product [Rotaria sp. Silwood1]
MSSSDQLQLKIMLGSNEEKIKLLTNIINNQTSTKDQIKSARELRVGINFELKQWQDVINDINMLEKTIDSTELQVMKSKATIQECCRKERVSMMNLIHYGTSPHDENEIVDLHELCIEGDNAEFKSLLEKSKEIDVNQYKLFVYRPLPNSSKEPNGLLK